MTNQEFNNHLKKYLNGTATKHDIELLEKFEDFAENAIQKLPLTNTKEDIKQTIMSSISNHSPRRLTFNTIYKYAAILVVILTVGYLGINQICKFDKDVNIVNTTNAPKTITLIDGSVIILNKNSSLSYSQTTFNTIKREVTLKGNAFFKVAKNKEKPFVVSTSKLQTQVLGTSFDINETQNDVKVTVSEGLVAVFDKNDTIRLKPNQQAIYSKTKMQLSSRIVSADHYDYWTKEVISLENITIEDLTRVLKDIYEIDFIFEDESLKTSKLSLTFNRNDNIEDIIKIVNLIKDNQLIKKNNKIIEVKTIN